MDTDGVHIDQVIYGSFLLSSETGGSCFRFEGVHSDDVPDGGAPAGDDDAGEGGHADAGPDGQGRGAGAHANASADPVGEGLRGDAAAPADAGAAPAAGDGDRPMAPLLVGPQPCPRPAEVDDFGLLQARDRASPAELLRNPYAAVDHLSLLACIGGEGHSFFVVREPWRNLQVAWAEVFGGVHRAVNRLLDEQLLGSRCPQRDVDLERAIKLSFLMPNLIWRKPPSSSGTKAAVMQSICRRRLNMACKMDIVGLVRDYERDVLLAKELEPTPAGRRSDENRVRRAADLMSRSKYGKARKEMLNNGLANKDDPRVVQQMDIKHPARKEELTPLSDDELSYARRGIDRENFMKELGRLDHDVGEGLGGLRNEHLTALLFSPQRDVTPGAAAAADDLYAFADNVVQCRLPDYFYVGYVATRLVPANKVDPSTLAPGASPDARPINVGNALRRLITRAFFDEGLLATINEIVGPVQNGAGLRGGISLTVLGVQASLEARPDFCAIQGDLKNGYNEVKRESVLASVRERPELHDTLAYFFKLLEPKSYVGMGSGTNVSSAPFRIEEGVQQGAVESLYMFGLSVNKPYRRARARLAEGGGAITAIVDDHYLLAKPRLAFQVLESLKADLQLTCGLELQPRKSAAYINEAFRDDDFEAMRVAAGIPDSLLLDRDGEPVLVHGQQVRGITVCNIPVGSAGFVDAYLTRKQASIIGDNDMIKALLDPRRWAQPEIPTRQLAFLMLRNCLQFRGDYWLRHLPPQLTATFAKELDESTWGFLEHALGDELSNWTNLGIRRLQLPVRRNGGGFRSCNSRKDAQYAGCLAQSALQLLDRKDDRGNVIPGRMHTPSLVNHFGETSFNHARDRDWHPWKHLLDNSNGNIATGLRQASSQMKTNFEEVAIDGMYDQDSCLVLQDVTRFGFNSDGTRPARPTSVTRIHSLCSSRRWSFIGCFN
ncbi:hypothetical protein THAOC_14871, partial [Thalassiosira oceanica]